MRTLQRNGLYIVKEGSLTFVDIKLLQVLNYMLVGMLTALSCHDTISAITGLLNMYTHFGGPRWVGQRREYARGSNDKTRESKHYWDAGSINR